MDETKVLHKYDTAINLDTASAQSANHSQTVGQKKSLFALIIFGLQVAIFMTSLERTIVATALPTIGSEFRAMSISPWVINSFGLAVNVTQPLFGKLSDIFGRKSILMFGLTLVLIGSVLCGVATTIIMLIACRAIQGIGAAATTAMVFIIITDLVPLEKRSNYQGITAMVFTLASVFGPLLGGVLTDNLNWRWNFYINIPFSVVVIIILFFALHLPAKKQTLKEKLMRIDYTGNLLILASITLLLVALNFGGQTYPWNSTTVILLLVFAGVLAALFILVEVKFAKEPLMPPRLFKCQTVAAAALVNVSFGMCFFAVICNIPIYFQVVRGDSATWSGIRIIPMEVALGVFAAISGFLIAKFGIYRPMMSGGLVLLTISLGLMCLLSAETSWTVVYIFLILNGIGSGTYLAGNSIVIQAAVDKSDVAVGISIREFMNCLGGSLGIAIASSLLNSGLQKHLFEVLPMEYAEYIMMSPEFIRNGLPSQYVDVAIVTYADAIKRVWYFLTAMSGFGFLCSLFIKHHSLKQVDSLVSKVDEDQPRTTSPSISEIHSACTSEKTKN